MSPARDEVIIDHTRGLAKSIDDRRAAEFEAAFLEPFRQRHGSSVAEEPGTRPGVIILNVGTFDDPTVANPGREIFRDDALPWVEVHGEIPRFAKRPG
jgi:hypothetical protein